MKIKIAILVLFICLIFTSKVSAADYSKQLKKTESNIRRCRIKLRETYKVIHKTKRIYNNFKKLDIDISKKVKFSRYLKKERLKSYRRAKRLKKKILRLRQKRKRLKRLLANSYCGVILQYDKAYNIATNKLTQSRGVCYYNGHRETFYSQRVLPGGGLRIPGRHVADDGTIRDKDGYIVVAANPGFYSRGSRLMISLGPAKVYDSGCAYGTIDVYVNW